MLFLRPNIDRAIVMTQSDLRGFWHPLGYRAHPVSAKSLCAITANLAGFASGLGGQAEAEEVFKRDFPDFFECSYDEYLAMCLEFVAACEGSTREAIQLIIQAIIVRYEELKSEAKTADNKLFANYLGGFNHESSWGRAILALQKAFCELRTDDYRQAVRPPLSDDEWVLIMEAELSHTELLSTIRAALVSHGIDDPDSFLFMNGITIVPIREADSI